jgi:hypothetical protein
MPNTMTTTPIILPPIVDGVISPYPTVVIVTKLHQKASTIRGVFSKKWSPNPPINRVIIVKQKSRTILFLLIRKKAFTMVYDY